MKIAIVDDEKIYRDEIDSELEQIVKNDKNIQIDLFKSGAEFMKEDARTYSIVLLDIEMPNMDGFELGAAIRKLKEEMIICFITNFDEKVYSSFKIQPFRFIRKKFLAEEIREMIVSACRELKSRRKTLCFDAKEGQINLNLNIIVYFEVYGHTLTCHTKTDEIYLKGSLDEMLKKVQPYGFIKPHNSYIVNMDFINFIGKTEIELIDDFGAIPLARPRAKQVKEQFVKFYEEG